MINLELFSCSGGMAEGFRRAGVRFDLAIDFAVHHCDSYERNLGHRPVQMDARDLLRMVHLGWRVEVDLLVADPPCTPWSRAGKRLGTADQRDMLEATCELIAALRPRRYLIGNIPGLDDSSNLPIVLLSERAAAILQGFPESWVFVGRTKKARWSQIGQAMPPALAEAVARAVVEQDLRCDQ